MASGISVTFEVACNHAPAHGGASVMKHGKVVGTVTSGDWGHRVGKNLCYAFVNADICEPGNEAVIDILGELIPVTVIAAGPYDPALQRVRS